MAHQDGRPLQPADHVSEVVYDGGHAQVLDRGRVGVEGLDLDLEAWVGREHAVALLLVMSLPVLPAARGHPKPWIKTIVSGFIGSLRAARVRASSTAPSCSLCVGDAMRRAGRSASGPHVDATLQPSTTGAQDYSPDLAWGQRPVPTAAANERYRRDPLIDTTTLPVRNRKAERQEPGRDDGDGASSDSVALAVGAGRNRARRVE